MKLENIYISAQSNYWSHPKGEPGSAATLTPSSVDCVAGSGLVGDRFFNFKENYKGQVTLISKDNLDRLQEFLKLEFDPQVLRRNLLVSGIDPLSLIGKQFQVGEMLFEGKVDCTPCFWMDLVIGEGAYQWLQEHNAGGLRAAVINSGTIQCGDLLKIN